MSKIIDMGEGKKLELETVSQYDSETAFEEAANLVELASMYADLTNPDVTTHLFREFIHWLYAKPGAHQKPTDLLREVITTELQEMNASTDAAPGKGKTND